MPPADTPLVTVLTPVHNGEPYFVECIESVLRQTHAHFEYIIVDNCSNDRTWEIAYSYAERDQRIRLHRNPTLVSHLRNHNIGFGLLSPDSRYCKVVHADDWLFPDCIRQMVSLAEREPSVGVVEGYSLCGADVVAGLLPYSTTVARGREICRRYLEQRLTFFLSPSSVLLRSDIIRSKLPMVYNEDHIYADDELCLEALQVSDFGYIHQVLAFVRPRVGSITAEVARRLETYLPSWLDMLRKFGPQCLEAAEYDRILSRAVDDYFRFLGRNLLRNRGKVFWDFHRGQLRQHGYPLTPFRLVTAAIREAVSAFGFPLSQLRKGLEPVR